MGLQVGVAVSVGVHDTGVLVGVGEKLGDAVDVGVEGEDAGERVIGTLCSAKLPDA